MTALALCEHKCRVFQVATIKGLFIIHEHTLYGFLAIRWTDPDFEYLEFLTQGHIFDKILSSNSTTPSLPCQESTFSADGIPERFAPATMPVTAGKKTANTEKKLSPSSYAG